MVIPGALLVASTALIVSGVVGASRVGRLRTREVHKRGASVLDGATRQRWGARQLRARPRLLTLARIPIAPLDETKHFKIIGTTGTGKSTAIRELLRAGLARGDRAIVADPDGGYTERYFNRYRGDVLLNPFEPHSRKWEPFGEIGHAYDIERLAAGLIPTGQDSAAAEWRGYARSLLAGVMRGCLRRRRADSTELWRLIATAPVEELRPVVQGTPAQVFLDADNARMFASIRSVTVSALAALEHVQAQRAAPVSVREWVRAGLERGACGASPGGGGSLFIPYRAAQIAALRSMIATWMRLAIFETMSAAEGRDQRLWFVIDELDALGVIDGLKDALARLRKFGGRCVLGFQSIAQVSSTYGAGEAQTIVENCGNTLILRCSGSENGGTSQFASRLIGEREMVRRQVARGHDREGAWFSRGGRRSVNVSEQHVTEVAVMASQIEQLPDLRGYFKAASSPAWLCVSLDGQHQL